MKETLDKLAEKYTNLDEPMETYLKGLLYQKPITYWDYIDTEALLSLQKPRTDIPDEMVFIMYHQVNEILFKMMLHEIQQLQETNELTAELFASKLSRVSRYFDMLTSSFTIMKDGMEPEQYLLFRDTLTPASGFQSAQYRMIEFSCTNALNLVDPRFRKEVDSDSETEEIFNRLYWQAAGRNFKTGEKKQLLFNFEKKYKSYFLDYMEKHADNNLYSLFLSLPLEARENKALVDAMRHLDYTINITWVMAHYNTAKKYLSYGQKDKPKAATGGSDWTKYMHPKYQRRVFFPSLWTAEELENWGEDLDQ